MTTALSYTLTRESATVVYDGKPHTVKKGSPNFENLRKALVEERWDDVPSHLSISKSLEAWAQGLFKINVGNRTVTFGDEQLPGDITDRLFKMSAAGCDPTPVFKFYERLQKNPSSRSVKQLFSFLQHQGIPLTVDGCFLAYKSVRRDYFDHHSGEWENKPGAVVKMSRNKISDDPDLACHEGFHVGALEYARTFMSGGRVMVVKVDPEHVVCVPRDSSFRKMRVCEYLVLGEHNGVEHLPSTVMLDGTCEAEAVEEAHEVESTAEKEQQAKKPKSKSKKAKQQAAEKEKKAKAAQQATNKRKTTYAKYEKMDTKELMGCSLDELRQYAGKGLLIVGASKIGGGKTALVTKILEVRRK